MLTTFLVLWMSAQMTIGECRGLCPLDDITRAKFAEAAQRAADETDGKPPKCANGSNCYCGDTGCRDYTQAEWDEFNRIMAEPVEPYKPPEPMDVPAVQVTIHTGPVDCNNTEYCSHTKFTCADKSRVLLTSENGTAHCIKFPEAK